MTRTAFNPERMGLGKPLNHSKFFSRTYCDPKHVIIMQVPFWQLLTTFFDPDILRKQTFNYFFFLTQHALYYSHVKFSYVLCYQAWAFQACGSFMSSHIPLESSWRLVQQVWLLGWTITWLRSLNETNMKKPSKACMTSVSVQNCKSRLKLMNQQL